MKQYVHYTTNAFSKGNNGLRCLCYYQKQGIRDERSVKIVLLLPFRSTWDHLRFSGVIVTLSLVLCVCFVNRRFSFYFLFFLPLQCLSFFDLRLLITPVVRSNFYYVHSQYNPFCLSLYFLIERSDMDVYHCNLPDVDY